MKVLFVFPTEGEAAALRKECPTADVAICGVGMAECGAMLGKSIMMTTPQMVILAGVAGAYGRNLAVGDVVEVIEERVAYMPERFAKPYKNKNVLGLRSVIGNTVCQVASDDNGADIENMEGAAFFATCLITGKKFAEVRAISNFVGEPFEQWDMKLANENLTRTLVEIYKHYAQ